MYSFFKTNFLEKISCSSSKEGFEYQISGHGVGILASHRMCLKCENLNFSATIASRKARTILETVFHVLGSRKINCMRTSKASCLHGCFQFHLGVLRGVQT